VNTILSQFNPVQTLIIYFPKIDYNILPSLYPATGPPPPTTSRTALGPTQPPIQWVPGTLSLGVKQLGCEADHSTPSSAENAWSYTPLSHAFMVWCSGKKSTGTTLPFFTFISFPTPDTYVAYCNYYVSTCQTDYECRRFLVFEAHRLPLICCDQEHRFQNSPVVTKMCP
jgi:hypothetical protein